MTDQVTCQKALPAKLLGLWGTPAKYEIHCISLSPVAGTVACRPCSFVRSGVFGGNPAEGKSFAVGKIHCMIPGYCGEKDPTPQQIGDLAENCEVLVSRVLDPGGVTIKSCETGPLE